MNDKPIIDMQMNQFEAEIAKLPYEILKSKDGKILSVRRKSDQAIFDAGQPVDVIVGNTTIKSGSIVKIWIDDSFSTGVGIQIGESLTDLILIQHKKPLWV